MQDADSQTKLRNDGSGESMNFVRYMLQNIKSLKNRVTPPKVIHDKKKVTFYLHRILKNIYLRDVYNIRIIA